jgi:hypothetical protein
VFGVIAPFAVLGLLATRHVPESRDPAAHGHFDVLGAVLGALALAGPTCALIAAGNDPGGTPVAVAGVVGPAVVTAFVVRERRTADPMLPLAVFADRQFTGTNLSPLAVHGAPGGASFFLVLHLQTVLGHGATSAGAAVLPT